MHIYVITEERYEHFNDDVIQKKILIKIAKEKEED